MENKNKKYYIEIWSINREFENPYIIQSRWFDTPEEALEWAKNIEYLDSDFCKSLMSTEWNEEENQYGDIELEYNI